MSDINDTAGGSGRVVVVEDDPLQAESLAFILRQEGYVVDLASTGAEALALARSPAGAGHGPARCRAARSEWRGGGPPLEGRLERADHHADRAP